MPAAKDSTSNPTPPWDVAIIGGALAGAASALQILKKRPGTRVLIIERATSASRKVGEATVEVSGYFLGRVLGLTHHLNHEHLVKQGMRFWFHNDQTTSLAQCSEIGGRMLSRLPSYQVDRSIMDPEVLRLATREGAQLLRPARVRSVQLNPGGLQSLDVETEGGLQQIQARWIVDASGPATLLARTHGWLRPNTNHPTASAWARWDGVLDLDDPELHARHPGWAESCLGIRATATNHFTGYGWWAWCIPLRNGQTSIGTVFDTRLADWPADGPLPDRLRTFLTRHSGARELLANASPVPNDTHWRQPLAYEIHPQAGDGHVLVGDAAGFLDPLYSPGMDWVAYTTHAAASLVCQSLSNPATTGAAVHQHNQNFGPCLERWFRALYRNKYTVVGDFELMRTAFLFDISLYFLGIVPETVNPGGPGLAYPPFSQPGAKPIHRLMETCSRRLSLIGAQRHKRGTYGRKNTGHRFLFPGFEPGRSSLKPLASALLHWFRLEAQERL